MLTGSTDSKMDILKALAINAVAVCLKTINDIELADINEALQTLSFIVAISYTIYRFSKDRKKNK